MIIVSAQESVIGGGLASHIHVSIVVILCKCNVRIRIARPFAQPAVVICPCIEAGRDRGLLTVPCAFTLGTNLTEHIEIIIAGAGMNLFVLLAERRNKCLVECKT